MKMLVLLALTATAFAQKPAPKNLAQDQRVGKLEVVHTFTGAMPTGVTVSKQGRIFVNYPKWGDNVPFTVAEIKNGQEVAYPSQEMNSEKGPQENRLVAVQSVVVDSQDRLWILDTGSFKFGPITPGGPKLIGIDLKTNQVVKKFVFSQDVALPTTYLNDVRFDLRRGKEGYAFITDSSGSGKNAIIVVDLATGKARRRLADHPSVKPDPNFRPIVEGEVMMRREAGQPPQPLTIGSDGIAIAHDGSKLYYCPLASRHLFSVDINALVDDSKSDDEVAKTVKDLGEKGASDGLESDAQGNLYFTEYETNGILRSKPDGTFETVAHDPRILWPDTMAIADDGYLYFTANQLHRQAMFHNGKDLRQKPYVLFRIKIDGTRVQR